MARCMARVYWYVVFDRVFEEEKLRCDVGMVALGSP